jgi:hypothetical protein
MSITHFIMGNLLALLTTGKIVVRMRVAWRDLTLMLQWCLL